MPYTSKCFAQSKQASEPSKPSHSRDLENVVQDGKDYSVEGPDDVRLEIQSVTPSVSTSSKSSKRKKDKKKGLTEEDLPDPDNPFDPRNWAHQSPEEDTTRNQAVAALLKFFMHEIG